MRRSLRPLSTRRRSRNTRKIGYSRRKICPRQRKKLEYQEEEANEYGDNEEAAGEYPGVKTCTKKEEGFNVNEVRGGGD